MTDLELGPCLDFFLKLSVGCNVVILLTTDNSVFFFKAKEEEGFIRSNPIEHLVKKKNALTPRACK